MMPDISTLFDRDSLEGNQREEPDNISTAFIQ